MMNRLTQNINFIRFSKVCNPKRFSPAQWHTSMKMYSDKATFEIKEFRLHNLTSGPSTSVTISSELALKLYYQMNVMRRMEGAAANLYREKFVRGFLHLYTGQEAVAAGMYSSMRPHDCAISAYRCHAWTYLMGVSVRGVLSELTGRGTGCAKGKGGSMHMYSPTFFGGNGIVGAQIPLGVGIAFAAKYNETDGVCVALYGDGAANQGQIFEVYNIACLWNLPVIFVCENNQYGMGTSTKRASCSTEFYTRGDYIPGIWVDGMDVLSTREVTRFAIEYCKSGKGPILLEMSTYRFTGHSMSDPGTSYRSREEIQDVRKNKDPITVFKDKLVSSGLCKEEECKALENKSKKEVDEATENAKTDKEIPVAEVGWDIWAKWDYPIRNILPDAPLKHKNVGKPFNTIK